MTDSETRFPPFFARGLASICSLCGWISRINKWPTKQNVRRACWVSGFKPGVYHVTVSRLKSNAIGSFTVQSQSPTWRPTPQRSGLLTRDGKRRTLVDVPLATSGWKVEWEKAVQVSTNVRTKNRWRWKDKESNSYSITTVVGRNKVTLRQAGGEAGRQNE